MRFAVLPLLDQHAHDVDDRIVSGNTRGVCLDQQHGEIYGIVPCHCQPPLTRRDERACAHILQLAGIAFTKQFEPPRIGKVLHEVTV